MMILKHFRLIVLFHSPYFALLHTGLTIGRPYGLLAQFAEIDFTNLKDTKNKMFSIL